MNLPGPSICTAFYFLSFSGPSFIGKRLGRRRANQPQMSRFLLANRRESPMTMPTEDIAHQAKHGYTLNGRPWLAPEDPKR